MKAYLVGYAITVFFIGPMLLKWTEAGIRSYGFVIIVTLVISFPFAVLSAALGAIALPVLLKYTLIGCLGVDGIVLSSFFVLMSFIFGSSSEFLGSNEALLNLGYASGICLFSSLYARHRVAGGYLRQA